MRRKLIILFLAVLATSAFVASCVKDIEKEGIYVTTRCYGTIYDDQTMQPLQGIKVVSTDGKNIEETVYSEADGTFSINITIEQLKRGCYLSVLPDSLYQIQDIKLDEMPLGIESYSVGSIWIEGPGVPVLYTDEVTDITATSAHFYGAILEDGYSTITERGFVFSTMQYPTVDDQKVLIQTESYTFDINMNLSPNTTYYVRAFARNGLGIGYGDQIEFTTLNGMPEVATLDVIGITSTTAVCSGYCNSVEEYPVTQCGICWGTSPNPDINNLHVGGAAGQSNFEYTMTSLLPSTSYYVRAYAVNSLGIAYGEQLTFTTLNGMPTVTTTPVDNITATTATAGGNVVDDGGFPVIRRGVCFSTSPYPQVTDSHTADGTGSGPFVSNLTGLTSGTTYYYRAYATNTVGTVYGEQMVFVTH